MSIEVPAADVIRLILQFLRENNLTHSFETLQQEAQICLNVADQHLLTTSILMGKWDTVLGLVKNILLPEHTLLDLYELIAEDMIQHGEVEGAAFVVSTFMKTRPSAKEYQERILRLEYFCLPNSARPNFDDSKAEKKKHVIQSIVAELVEAPPQRLLKLLAQSLKYQAQQGIISPSVRLDLFADRVFEYKEEEESIVRAVEKIVKYPQESRVSAMQFSNGGEHLALGFEDGLIELYDPNQYKIDTKLEYQGSNFLFHGSAVTALAFQETDEMLASGDKTGQLKIWNLRNGKCLRKINTGSHPVSALTFGPDPSHVICAYEAIDVYGLKSTTVLRSFKGHASYVNSVRVLEERNQLFSCSRDGSIKVWNYLTQEEMKSYSPSTQSVVQPEINKLVFFDSCQRVLICTRGNSLVLTQPELRSFDSLLADSKDEEFTSWAVSGHKGLFVYSCLLTSDKKHKMVAHNRQNKRVEFCCLIDGEVREMAHHPTRNILVVSKTNGNVEFWRP